MFDRGLEEIGWAWLKYPLMVTAVILASVSGMTVCAQDPVDYFRANCITCHTIGGGRLTGPDLKNVTERQERPWLVKFVTNPRAVIDSGDPYAKKLFEEARRVPMPTPPGITKELAEKLLNLIESESKLEESQFKGLQISKEPFTDADRVRGKELFRGLQRLEAGGTACVSCHSIHGTARFGGGRLGPDLTNVYSRLGGEDARVGMSAWLMAPATATMQPIFKNHPLSSEEIYALVAYFEASNAEQPEEPSTNQVAFLLSGLVGAVLGVFVLDAVWKRRFHSVRRALVEAHSTRGEA